MKSFIRSIVVFFVEIKSEFFSSSYFDIRLVATFHTMVFFFLFCLFARAIAFIFISISSWVQCPIYS